MWTLLLSCTPPKPAHWGPESTDPGVTTPVPTTPTVPALDSADTGTPTTPTGTTPTCTSLAPAKGPIQGTTIDLDPPPFDLRADGTMWIGENDGLYLGTSPQNATLQWADGRVSAVREAPDGSVWFVAQGTLYHGDVGGSEVPVAAGIELTDDLALSPTGKVLLTSWSPSTGAQDLRFVDPDPEVGQVVTLDYSAWPISRVVAVAWSLDGSTVWLQGDGLWWVPTGSDGAPDVTATPTQVIADSSTSAGDLEVDACGGVVLFSVDFPFGKAGRYDPVTGVATPFAGTIDHGYGNSPLRFGKEPGTETQVTTATGGWSTVRRNWMSWDLGIPAAP